MGDSQELPEPLRSLALAYLVQVSNMSEKNMIDMLVRHSKENEHKLRPHLINTGAEVARFLESTIEQGDIL